MIIVSFIVNLVVLVPLLMAFAGQSDAMTSAFGPNTDARRILIAVYAAIALLSAAGLALIAIGHSQAATTLAVGLFSVQVVYKLLTVFLIGLSSPLSSQTSLWWPCTP
ncbi:MAG: hypothetical protein AAGK92_12480 [Pseudomonadota bacterium]